MEDNPDLQKGLWTALTSVLGIWMASLSWFFRRRITIADKLDERVDKIEQTYCTRDELKAYHADTQLSISKVHTRVDDIHKILIEKL